MTETLSMVYIARHGETAWSLSGQHLITLPREPASFRAGRFDLDNADFKYYDD